MQRYVIISKRSIFVLVSVFILLVAWWSCHHGSSSNPSQGNATGGSSGRGSGVGAEGAVPIVAAISTAIGALIPIIRFFFMTGIWAVIATFAVSIVPHFDVRALKSLITIRSWWASGLEMTMVGVIEAAVTYSLGLAFGAIS